MARYSKIGVQIWGDEKFNSLSKPEPNAQFLWFYLLANPAKTSVPGLFSAGERALAEGLSWSTRSFRRCFDEIAKQGMVRADWQARLVWIPKMVRWDPPNGPNVAKAWGRVIRQLPECRLRCEAEQFIDAFLHGMSDAIHKAFREGIGNAIPYAIGNGVAISDNRLPPTDNRLPPPQPSPMPSPPPPGHGEGGGNGADQGAEDQFYAAYAAKVRELTRRHGHPLPAEVIAELENWKGTWKREHGLEESA